MKPRHRTGQPLSTRVDAVPHALLPAGVSRAAESLLSLPDAAISKALKTRIGVVLGLLTAREEQVLRMHFGIGESSGQTLDDIGMRIGLPRQQIAFTEAKALRKLRRPGRSFLRDAVART